MGKNHKKKVVGKKMSPQTKMKLQDLVESLLLKCSEENKSWKDEWEQFKEIYAIIEEIRFIEKDTQLSFPDRVNHLDPFLNWCSQNGAFSKNVVVKQTDGKDFGVFAEENLKENDLYFVIPRKLMMSTQTAKESKLGPVIEKDPVLKKMPNVLLALHLLVEFTEENSFWMPYINIMPSNFSTILYFSINELEDLKGSPTLVEAVKICRSIGRQYGYFHKLFQVNSDLKKLNLRNYFTYDLYRWAVSCVMTRQNAIPSDNESDSTFASLVPLWDLCNHQNNKFSTDFNLEKNQLECYAMQNFDKGGEVFIFYGPRSNSELFLHSGFIDTNNPNDFFPLKLGISKSDPLYKHKEELCLKNGLPTSSCFNLMNPNAVNGGKYTITKDLLKFCQILITNKDYTENENGKIPIEIRSFLTTRISLLLRAYKTSVEDDENRLLSEANLSNQKQMAIALSLSEKRLLTALLSVLPNL